MNTPTGWYELTCPSCGLLFMVRPRKGMTSGTMQCPNTSCGESIDYDFGGSLPEQP